MTMKRERFTRKRRPIASALSIFWQFFIFYFFIFLLSVSVLLAFLIPTALNAARMIDQGGYDNLMEEAGQYVQDVLSEITLVKGRLEHSEWFQDLFFKNIARGDALTVEEKEKIRVALTEYTIQSPTISMVAFVFDGDNTLYNQFTIISDWRKYQKYDVNASLKYRFFPLEAGQDGSLSIQTYMVSGREFSALVYRSAISNLMHSNWNRPKGVINITLNTYTLQQNLRNILDGKADAFRLLDAKGKALISSAHQAKEEDDITLTVPLQGEAYRLEVDVPAGQYADTENAMRKTILVIAVIDTILCLVAMYLFSKRNYLPIRNLSTQIAGAEPQAGGAQNELVVLDEGIRLLKQEREIAQSQLDAAKPLFRQRFLMNMLSGSGIDPEDEARMASYGIFFPYSAFRVVEVRLPLLGCLNEAGDALGDRDVFLEADVAFSTAVEQQQSDLPICVYLHAMDFGCFQLIVNYQLEEALQAYMQRLNGDCAIFFAHAQGAEKVCFGVGGIVDAIDQLAVSAQSASAALNWGAINERGGVFWADRIPIKTTAEYNYTIANEIALSNAMANGLDAAAIGVLDRVIRENIEYAGFSRQNAACLHYDLLSTMHKTIRSLELPSQILDANDHGDPRNMSISAMRPYLEEAIRLICEAVRNRSGDRQVGLEQRIMEYVEHNLFNSMLSLGSIADSFGVSMSYVSAMFKSQTGIAYSEYINKARIRKAVQLLAETDLSMDEVIERTGYISLSTFRRNFARYANATPGQIVRKDKGKDDPEKP